MFATQRRDGLPEAARGGTPAIHAPSFSPAIVVGGPRCAG